MESVRGREVRYSVQTLVNRASSRSAPQGTLGRPILYRTTDKFFAALRHRVPGRLPSVDFSSGARCPSEPLHCLEQNLTS